MSDSEKKAGSEKVNWSDFGDMEVVDQGPNGSIFGVSVDLRNNPAFDKEVEGKYNQEFIKQANDKILAVHNSVVALAEKRPDQSIKLVLTWLHGLTPFQQESFFKKMYEQGYKPVEGLSVPHSNDSGAWLSRLMKSGEELQKYQERLKLMMKDNIIRD